MGLKRKYFFCCVRKEAKIATVAANTVTEVTKFYTYFRSIFYCIVSKPLSADGPFVCSEAGQYSFYTISLYFGL